MREIFAKHVDKVRFGLIGVLNTGSDFVILNILAVLFGVPVIVANTISTGLCMLMSFFLNRRWTFRASGKNYGREVGLFFGFTIIGMWVIGNGIIALLVPLMPESWAEIIRLNLPKLVATIASLIWNYLTYKYVVFRKPPTRHSRENEISDSPARHSREGGNLDKK
jgi:putative flippase GtrA